VSLPTDANVSQIGAEALPLAGTALLVAQVVTLLQTGLRTGLAVLVSASF